MHKWTEGGGGQSLTIWPLSQKLNKVKQVVEKF